MTLPFWAATVLRKAAPQDDDKMIIPGLRRPRPPRRALRPANSVPPPKQIQIFKISQYFYGMARRKIHTEEVLEL